jgi:hypothetical protein
MQADYEETAPRTYSTSLETIGMLAGVVRPASVIIMVVGVLDEIHRVAPAVFLARFRSEEVLRAVIREAHCVSKVVFGFETEEDCGLVGAWWGYCYC